MSGKISIAFPNGNIVPASVLGAKEDVRVPAHTAIEVPEAYGRHLIDDKFAYAAKVDENEKAGKKKAGKTEKATQIAAAEAALADAQKELDAAGDDLAAKASAEQKVETAKSALDALKD